MKITVLGCGGSAGVPMVGGADGHGIWGACNPKEPRNTRTRSSILLRLKNGAGVLVDTGPDLRAQLLVNGIKDFESIIFTHAHADHISGLDEVRAINRVIQKPLHAYGAAETLEDIQRRFDYVFKPWTPPNFFRAVVEAHPVKMRQPVTISGTEFTLFDQVHGRVGSTGVRCGDFVYSTDVMEFPEDSVEVLRGVDTWMVDCFQRQPHSAHAWLERVLEWQQAINPRRMILTHMGPDMDWQWMQDHLPAGIEPAWDGAVFEVADP